MTYYYYKDAKGEWRWRLAANGRIIADSGEGYKNEQECLNDINRVKGFIKRSSCEAVAAYHSRSMTGRLHVLPAFFLQVEIIKLDKQRPFVLNA